MNQVYFHSDDAGATAQVTQTILQAWLNDHISSFSVLANGEAIQDVTDALQDYPTKPVRIAAHLNLSEGPSLSTTPGAYISNQNGELTGRFGNLLVKWLTLSKPEKSRLRNEIKDEWQAQIDRVKAICAPRQVDALDGHMHIHMLPFLFEIACELAQENQIQEIRLTKEPWHLSPNKRDWRQIHFLVNCIKHLVLRSCCLVSKNILDRFSLSSPDAVIGVLHSGLMTADNALAGINAAERRGNEKTEVLFHIGGAHQSEANRWHDSQDIGEFYLSEGRQKEQEELILLHDILNTKDKPSA